VPFDVRTVPFAPIPNRPAVFVPVPRIRSPVLVIGERALNAAEALVCPVPPEPIANVPPSVTAPVVLVDGVRPVVPAENEDTVFAVVASVPLVGKVTLVLALKVPVNV